MKHSHYLYLFSILAIALSGCASAGSETEAISTATQLPSPTPIPPTLTFTPDPTQTATPIPPATLQPEQAKDFLRTLLREPECLAPCFFGITPEKTTLGEAKNIFAHLGLELVHTNTQSNYDAYALIYDFDNGLHIGPILRVENAIVKNLRVKIHPEDQKAGIPREWSAYSPETLIRRYGPPSRVEFILAKGPATSSSFGMIMYFGAIDLIVEYGGQDIIPPEQWDAPHICPLTIQFEYVRVWMEEDPGYPTGAWIPLEEATDMSMEEFASLMTGNPEAACFTLKGDKLP